MADRTVTKIGVEFETRLTPDELHEHLCTGVHEGSIKSWAELEGGVDDIRLLNVPDVKTYIIANSEYMIDGPSMSDFVGTKRQLLEYMAIGEDETGSIPTHTYLGDGDVPLTDICDERLIDIFNNANGDGQPYQTVWCVEDHKQVLG